MSKYKFCPQCGEKVLPGAMYCVGCGFQVATEKVDNAFRLYGLLGAMALSVAVYGTIRYGMDALPKTMDIPHGATDHAHGHDHDDPPALANLKAQAVNGDPASLLALAEGQIQFAAQDGHYLQEAAETLERLVISYPNHAYSLRLLANIYYDLGNGPKSIEFYQRYLILQPNDANALTDMGTQMLSLERVDGAIAAYQEAIKIFPNFYNAYYNLYRAYDHMGDTEKAEAAKKKAEEIEATHGRKLAPDPKLSRLPEGVDGTAPTPSGESSAPVSEPVVAENLESEGIDYMPVHAFFKVHPIIGPKLAGFKAEDGKGIMTLNNFPMDKMPPAVRSTLDTKISTMLQALNEKSVLEVRDQATNRLMMTYTGKAE